MLTLVRTPTGASRDEAAAGEADELAPAARAALSGDPGAVRAFVARIGPALLRTVRRVMGPAHPDVEDVTQEAAFAVMTALPSFRGACSTLHFVCRVAVLTAMGARRRARYREEWTPSMPPDELATIPDQRASPLAEVMVGKRRSALRRILDEMPLPQAEVMELHFILGYTVDQIAAAADIPRDTVRSRLRAGKRAMLGAIDRDPVLREILEGEA